MRFVKTRQRCYQQK